MNSTPVLAFVWSDETHSAELEAFFQSHRRRARRRPRIGAFVAAQPPRTAVPSRPGSSHA